MQGRVLMGGLLGSLMCVAPMTHASPILEHTPSNVTKATTGFEFTAGALFLQPTGTNLDYAILGFPFPTLSPHWYVESIKPDYTAGFYLGGRYIFQETDHDMQLNWSHLNTSDSDATYAGSGQFTTPLFQSGPSVGQQKNPAMQQAHATTTFHYDVINLDVGQSVTYGSRTQLRFFGGLSGAQLKQSLQVAFQDNGATYRISSQANSQFNGVGPLFGIDAVYQLPKNLDLVGKVAGSTLIGSSQPQTTYTSYSPQLAASGISLNKQGIYPAHVTQVVPGFDGALGVHYSYPLNKGSILSIEVGYEYATYFNAIVAYNPITVVGEVDIGTIALDSLGKTTSNFSVNGPYLNLSLAFG